VTCVRIAAQKPRPLQANSGEQKTRFRLQSGADARAAGLAVDLHRGVDAGQAGGLGEKIRISRLTRCFPVLYCDIS